MAKPVKYNPKKKYLYDKCKCGHLKHKRAKRCWLCFSGNKRGQLSRSYKSIEMKSR